MNVEQTTAPLVSIGAIGSKAPWYILLALTFLPGIVAVLMTTVSTIVIRHVNRADKNPPLKVSRIVVYTLLIGAFWGTVMQWGLQNLTTILTGIPQMNELILVGALTTGFASMAFYELLRWWCKRKGYNNLYATITVKHSSNLGHTGDSEPSDLTVYSEDITEEK